MAKLTTAVLAIRGTTFRVPYACLQKQIGQKLKQFYTSSYITDKGEDVIYHLNRPLAAFESILEYCHNGKLHFPLSVCPGVFRDELAFWEIPANLLERCCYHRYSTFLRDQEKLRGYDDACVKEKQNIKTEHSLNNTISTSRKLWYILDYREDTFAAKFYFCLSSLVILVAILNFVVATLPFADPYKETKCELNGSVINEPCNVSSSDQPTDKQLNHKTHKKVKELYIDCKRCALTMPNIQYINYSFILLSSTTANIAYSMYNCCLVLEVLSIDNASAKRKRRSLNDVETTEHWQSNITDLSDIQKNESQLENQEDQQSTKPFIRQEHSSHNTSQGQMKINVLNDIKISAYQRLKQLTNIMISDPFMVVVYIEYTTTTFFAVEFTLKLLTCPDKHILFQRFLNLVDLILLIASLGRVVVMNYFESKVTLLEVLLYASMFRVLRLLRIVENVTAFKVLIYSLRSGKKDLFVLLMYMLVAMFIFSNFIFIFEKEDNFLSIPDAWWWSMITMTTVGYGDVYPKTAVGKIIGCLCAISGVILISLVIPVFVSTFLSIYGYADSCGRNERQYGKKDSTRKAIKNETIKIFVTAVNEETITSHMPDTSGNGIVLTTSL